MEFSEYLKKRKALDAQHLENCKLLSKEYATANSEVKHGDILDCNDGLILVDAITFTNPRNGHEVPVCYYRGPKVRKGDFKPFVNKERGCTSQHHDFTIIKRGEVC